MPEGSWKCEKCNNINYPFRSKCNRQNCGADKPSDTVNSPLKAAGADDQVCCALRLICMTAHLKFLVSFGTFRTCIKFKNHLEAIYMQTLLLLEAVAEFLSRVYFDS